MAADDEVRAASGTFYAALNRMLNGDAGPMGDIWSHDAGTTTMHPVGGRQIGWDEVRGSWEAVAALSTDGQVELADQLIRVVGDAAYELGVERGGFSLAGQRLSVDGRVTNIYRREGGAWKIVHHHADLSPAMADLLARMHG